MSFVCSCVYITLCVSTQMHTYFPCSLWQLSGLAARPCLSAHPYDIIWHWSSCLLSPPSLLLLPSSSPPSLCSQPEMDGGKDGECQTLFCFHACSVYPDTSISLLSTDQFQHSYFQVFSLFFCLPITSAFSLSSPLVIFSFSSISPCLFPPFCCSRSLSHSIVNFNLRAGLNGTIRERSMLLIWMPAHLDLSVPHQRRKKITLFIIRQTHQLTRSHSVYTHAQTHTDHWSKSWMQETENICALSNYDRVNNKAMPGCYALIFFRKL